MLFTALSSSDKIKSSNKLMLTLCPMNVQDTGLHSQWLTITCTILHLINFFILDMLLCINTIM